MDRNKDMYLRWVEGETYDSIAKSYGITRERVRQICRKMVRKENPADWRWLKWFDARAEAVFIKNNIHNEADLHKWWGDGKKLHYVNLSKINKQLNKPLVYTKEPKKRGVKVIDLTGMRFGRLTVIKKSKIRKNNAVCWECLCDCGNTTIVRGDFLRKGVTKSCGCLLKEYRSGLKGKGIKGLVNVVNCRECKHYEAGTCKVWNTVTDPSGFCYNGIHNG